MLAATEQETQHILDYMSDQASDETVEFVQKVYSEQLHSLTHDIWDVHTNRGRWWIITNPMNLYSQHDFPNMDLALTFHVGLCLRIPSSERRSLADFNVEPVLGCWRILQEASEALRHAEEVEDFQAIGMRCRESLITMVHAAQETVTYPELQSKPKRSDFRAWSVVIADAVLSGSTHQDRRALLKSTADNAWKFTNWVTHAKEASFNDAEAALSVTELALSLFTTALVRHIRGVPDRCPSCGSHRLAPERGINTNHPDMTFERPVCQKCNWIGEPVEVSLPPRPEPARPDANTDCVIMTKPLRDVQLGRTKKEN